MSTHQPLGVGQTSVWTGREMIVWSGAYRAEGRGAAFDPRANRWRDIPSYRMEAIGAAVTLWTDGEMVLWGGVTDGNQTPSNSGGIYDPASNQWRAIAPAPLTGGNGYFGVWTGSEVLVWGVGGTEDAPRTEMAAFEPDTGIWTSLDPGPLSVRYDVVGGYTGREFLVWGGALGAGDQRRYYTDGAAFDPRTRRWRRMASAPIDGRADAGGVWTGTRLFVWGGFRGETYYRDGTAYDAGSNRWERISEAPIDPRRSPSVTWTGRAVIIRSGAALDPGADLSDLETSRTDGAMYIPATKTWLSLPPANLVPRLGELTVWTGSELIVWSGCCTTDGLPFADGAIYTP